METTPKRKPGERQEKRQVNYTRCSSSELSTLDVEGTLVNIIHVFGRNNDRNVQRFVNERFCDRVWTYLCIEIIVSSHVRYFVGPNAVTFQSQRCPKIVILHL